ncbi:hypothetical protein [Actinomarinicola tropica]|uniref:Uncharacterized protein n=1 Tax=Actinomarinicola tropica TaxID=2789776 RepID=A0A5Q2RK07_9ACTN|nr:hypothetical protein [Actinomarinicola tropica]QGG94387.1 hypothetical protein GH723_04310 [Actinomarinicola tropica]
MQTHLRKHLIQGLFLLAIAATARAAELDISATGIVVAVVLSLVTLELGIRFVHRHDVAT